VGRLFISLTYILLSVSSPEAGEIGGGVWRPNPAYEEGLVPEKAPEEHAVLKAANEISVEKRRELSFRLEAYLDNICFRYRTGRINERQAIEAIANPEVFQSTGFILRFLKPKKIIIGIPTAQNREDWRDYGSSHIQHVGRAVGLAENEKPSFVRPGFVRLTKPIVDNGHDLYASENKLLAQRFFLSVAEEAYHIVQDQRTGDLRGSAVISEFLKTDPALTEKIRASQRIPGNDLVNRVADLTSANEADIYAKLLEVLGPEIVPEYFEKIGYEARKMIDRKAIKPSPEPTNLEMSCTELLSVLHKK